MIWIAELLVYGLIMIIFRHYQAVVMMMSFAVMLTLLLWLVEKSEKK